MSKIDLTFENNVLYINIIENYLLSLYIVMCDNSTQKSHHLESYTMWYLLMIFQILFEFIILEKNLMSIQHLNDEKDQVDDFTIFV